MQESGSGLSFCLFLTPLYDFIYEKKEIPDPSMTVGFGYGWRKYV